MSHAMPYKGYAFENRAREDVRVLWGGGVSPVSEVPWLKELAHAFYDHGWGDRGSEIDALNELIARLRETAIRVCEVRGRPHPSDRSPLNLAVTELGDALAELGWEGWK